MNEEYTFASQFMADVRAVMADMGEHMLGVPVPDEKNGGEKRVEVPALAKEHGHERLQGGEQAFANERARLATSIVFCADMPIRPARGDVFWLFGAEWQARSVRSMGVGQGQALRLTLTCDERTRGNGGR